MTLLHTTKDLVERVGLAHVANQVSDFRINAIPAYPSRTTFPAPEQFESLPMPFDDGFQPHNDQSVRPAHQKLGKRRKIALSES